MLHMLPDRAQLAAKYRKATQDETDASQKNAATTLELLARNAEADRMYPTRPLSPFTVIKGGKSDDPPEEH